jgi:hypothetical protein
MYVCVFLCRVLEILDLAFNYFNSEDELEPLTTLPRLVCCGNLTSRSSFILHAVCVHDQVTLMLYGNPVLGPTGEDPMYIYIENLVEVGYKNRDGSNIKDIDVSALRCLTVKKWRRNNISLTLSLSSLRRFLGGAC